MATYLVTIQSTRIPAVRLTAGDVVELGEHIAAHLVRHKALRPGHYDALVGDHGGQITQPLLTRPIDFTIRKEA